MPTAPPTYTALSANCQWQGFKSTRDGVANGTIKPWPQRLLKLVSIIKDAHAALVMTQEVGHDEAAQIAEKLGSSWSYQRNGLASIFWSDHWKIEDPGHANQSRDWQLTPYGQMAGGRTLITCRLRHTQTGQYVFAASCHLASNSSWGLSAIKAAQARYRQAKEVADHLHGYRQILLGADTNSKGALPGTPRAVLKGDGWSFLDPIRAVDAVGAKNRVILKSVSVVQLGDASDHDGRLIRFQIVDPPNPA
jgi:hypothetical protein